MKFSHLFYLIGFLALIALLLAVLPFTKSKALTFTVTTTSDNGDNANPTPGSLRKAIIDANTAAGSDTIQFAVPGAGVRTINPPTPLPACTGQVTIDGWSQGGPGYTGPPLIEIDGSSGDGLSIIGPASTVRGLILNDFTGAGITLSDGHTIEGCYIGTNSAGTADQPNFVGISVFGDNNTIGGTTASARNIISGNDNQGILVAGGTGNLILGNFIGTDVTGTVALGNVVGIEIGSSGNTIGGTTAGAANLISGNFNGIQIGISSNNQVLGNLIGTDSTGIADLGNDEAGIQIGGSNQVIGGTGAGAGNTIAFNPIGVTVFGTGNAIRGNSLFSNDNLGIDLGEDGVTANDLGDPDTGPNNLQNFPVITSAINCTNTAITGTLNSTATTVFNLDFYSSPSCDGSGNGEGMVFLGSIQVTTNGSGNASFAFVASGTVPVGSFITATATRNVAPRDTSEFSACVAVSQLIDLAVTNTNDSGVGSLRQAILNANSCPGLDIITFNIAGAGVKTIAPASALPNITDPVVIDGTTQPGFSGSPLIELNGAGAGVVSGLRITGGGSTIKALVVNRFTLVGIVLISNGNSVQGSYIGLDAAGNVDLGNGAEGIQVDGNNNTIGGTTAAARNVVSGNGRGVSIITSSTGNTVQGNFIGTNAAGTADRGNTFFGVEISNSSGNTVGGTTHAARNIISGNNSVGILILASPFASSNNLVQGNFIGTDVNGTVDLGNSADGIEIRGGTNNTIGGAVSAARNIISGNNANGVLMSTNATGNLVQGNFIGMDVNGNADLGNTANGISISGSPSNTIGGTASGARNIISGNNDNGVLISSVGSTGNLVQNNFIGTDVSGSLDRGNSINGVEIDGAANNTIGGRFAERNVISGNNLNGVELRGGASGNIVQSNLIGTSANGTGALGNLNHGVSIIMNSSDNLIGGTAAGNTVAHNGDSGVAIVAGTGNRLASNSIFSNGSLGIDLGDNGVTPNDVADPDTGPNNLQNFPLVLSAIKCSAATLINSTLNSTPNTLVTIEFFSNPSCDTSGHGEGQTLLGSTNVTTDGTGNVSFTFTASTSVTVGHFVTATATRNASPADTSEFSPCVQITDLTVTNTGDSGAGTLRLAIQTANDCPGLDTIPFNIPGGGVKTINLASALPPVFDPVVIDGTAQPGFAGAPLIELNGTGAGTGADGIIIFLGGSTIKGLVINRFGGSGINVLSDGNTIQGCYIGTDSSGSADLGNANGGVSIGGSTNIIGGTTVAARNVISGNDSFGVAIAGVVGSTGNLVQGNFIGTDVTGSLSLGNTQGGVFIAASSNNLIGGTAAGAGNRIANNGGDALFVGDVLSTQSNRVLANSIFANGGLGIDLSPDGVNANDAGDPDTGPNNRQNFPILTSFTSNSVSGSLNSTPSRQFRLEFFANASCDPAGNGEGEVFLGSLTVSTDSGGDTSFTFNFTPVPGKQFITATATDNNTNDTSEFSPCFTGPTYIDLVSLEATRYDDGTFIEWQTGLEVDNLGFNIYREHDGKRSLVNSRLVAGSALLVGSNTRLGSGHQYWWWDGGDAAMGRDGDKGMGRGGEGANAAYWLEDVDLKGQSTWHGPFYAQRKEGSPGEAGRNAKTLSQLGSAQSETLPVELRASAAASSSSTAAVHLKLIADTLGGTKLRVKREAWYRVSGSELIAAGIEAGVDPRNLQLFVGGKQQAIRVTGDEDGRLDAEDAVEFYGVGLDSPFSELQTYYLVAGQSAGLRVGSLKAAAHPSPVGSFESTVERRDRLIYFAALRNGDAENFFGAVVAGQPVDQSITLKHLAPSEANATLTVALQGVTTLQHQVSVSLNGAVLGQLVFEGQSRDEASFSISSSLLVEGENRVTLSSRDRPSDVSLVDNIRVSYQRLMRADDNALKLVAQAGQQLTIGGFTGSEIQVFDVTDPLAVEEIAGHIGKEATGTYSVSLIAPAKGGERTLLALTREPASAVGAIFSDEPSSLRTAGPGADLIVISRQAMLASLEPLVELRRKQGLSVMLVDVEDIYDEFSFGNKTPQAVKEFLEFASSQWKKKPRYVLLVGDASYDPKNYLGLGWGDLVPTKLVDTNYMETASDDWLADLNNDGVAELAIGRLPVRTAEEARSMVSKIVASEMASPSQELMLVADENDGFDFEAANGLLVPLVPNSIRVTRVNRGRVDPETAKKILLDGIHRGQKLVNYTGHGSVSQWRGNLLTEADARRLINERLPLFVMMTCLNGYFQDAVVDSLGESLMKAEGGGVAVWASTGMTFPETQAAMNRELYRLMFAGKSSLTIGEAARRAKLGVSNPDVRRTWVLLGDPATRIR